MGLGGNRIAVRFEYEYHDNDGIWFGAYGNENWEFDEHGLMKMRYAASMMLKLKQDILMYQAQIGVYHQIPINSNGT